MKREGFNSVARPHIKQAMNDLEPVMTSHGSGIKRILTAGYDMPVLIKQIAVGRLEPGESIEQHVHVDMDEHYFVSTGSGKMEVAGTVYDLKAGDFVLVTAGSWHRIFDVSESLEFYYQGFELVQEQHT